VFSNAMRMMLTCRCMAVFTMEYASEEMLVRTLRDTESIANRIGASMNPDSQDVSA
jgi:hypothetical protein